MLAFTNHWHLRLTFALWRMWRNEQYVGSGPQGQERDTSNGVLRAVKVTVSRKEISLPWVEFIEWGCPEGPRSLWSTHTSQAFLEGFSGGDRYSSPGPVFPSFSIVARRMDCVASLRFSPQSQFRLYDPGWDTFIFIFCLCTPIPLKCNLCEDFCSEL